MTDRKAEKILNSEADEIVSYNRTKVLHGCGATVKEKNHPVKAALKVLSVAAGVLFIAALAYVCYLPIYMQEHGLTPGAQPTDTVDTSKVTAQVVGIETDPVTEEKIIRIDEYMKNFVLPDDSEAALKNIYLESAHINTSGYKILIPKTAYTDEFIRTNYSEKPETVYYDGKTYYRFDTAFNKTDFYLVFLAAVDSLEDYRYDADPDYQLSYDRLKITWLVFCSEFKKQGYSSLTEMRGDQLIGAPKYYSVSYTGAEVRLISPLYNDHTNYADVWYDEASRKISSDICYGEYNGYKVSLERGILTVISNIDVGGYSFRYGSSFQLKAEKYGVSYDLSEVYEKGDLTEDDIAKINMIHRSLYGLYYDSPEEFEKAARYNAGLTEIMNNNTDQAVISKLQLSLFKSIYGKSGTDPVEEITLPDYSGYENAFAPDRFLVCIMKKSDGSEFTVEDFPEVKLSAVRKLMDFNDGTCALVLYLKNHGKDNVLEAIRLMLARDGVRSAEPDWIRSIDG